jgi:hypothetical protein
VGQVGFVWSCQMYMWIAYGSCMNPLMVLDVDGGAHGIS